jgi:hypothetical protein
MAIGLQRLEAAIRANGGNVTKAAEQLTMTRAGLYARIQKSEHLQTVLLDIRESTVDLAENVLITALKEGNLTAAIFIAKTQGRARGYSERVEMTGADGGAIVVKGYTSVNPDDWSGDDSSA